MLNPKEIEKIVAKTDSPPDNFSNIEMHLFFVLQDILINFRKGRISKGQASNLKRRAFNNYQKVKKEYEVYKYYTKMIVQTEKLRIELRKEKKWETALKLIELYSGEVGMWID